MKNRYRILLLFAFISIFPFSVSYAQKKDGIEYSGFFDTYYFRGPLNFTAGGGLTTFNGDICQLFDCGMGYFANVGASYQVWPRTYFGAELMYVTLTGSRSDTLNYSFDNAGIQFEAFGRFLLLDKKVTRHGQLRERPYLIRPYIYGGIGIFHSLTPVSNYNRNVIGLDGTNTQVENVGFDPFVITIPAGIGFQIWFSHRVSIMPEFIYRFALSDNLDGVVLGSDVSGMDAYGTVGLKVQITPTAKRVRKKKTKLTPPEEYTGPKGTDYPRKRREQPKPKQYGQPLPDENQDDQGGWDTTPQEGQEENQDGWDTTPQENQENQDNQQQQNDDWGW